MQRARTHISAMHPLQNLQPMGTRSTGLPGSCQASRAPNARSLNLRPRSPGPPDATHVRQRQRSRHRPAVPATPDGGRAATHRPCARPSSPDSSAPSRPAAVRGALAAALTPFSGPAPHETAQPGGLSAEQRQTTQSRINAIAASLERSNARLRSIEPGSLFHRAALTAIEALLEESQRLAELLSPSPTIRPSG